MDTSNNLTLTKFKNIDLSDPFFDSLKSDYTEFSHWFLKKSEDVAYIFQGDNGAIEGFLYLKTENGPVADCEPPLPSALRIKVGTLKINAHGTKLGERFIKKIVDHVIANGARLAYVTVFAKHTGLVRLLRRYGFRDVASKTTSNGVELVLQKTIGEAYSDPESTYPTIPLGKNRCYLLSLQPRWHTRLLPDSILQRESASIVSDVSHANSIHKVYLTAMRDTEVLSKGDVLVIYRTSPEPGRARFLSVATSLCVVEEFRSIRSFASKQEFLDYCSPYSIFTSSELEEFWRTKKYPNIFKFTYNVALRKRPNRSKLIEDVGLDEDAYWGFLPLTYPQLRNIAKLGEIDESLIVDQA